MKRKLPIMEIKQTPAVKTAVNVGALMDITTGDYIEGLYGEMILNGGVSSFEAMVGGPNLGKTNISHFRILTAAKRLGEGSTITVYDTELTLNEQRVHKLIETYTKDDPLTWVDPKEPRWQITDSSVYPGDEWFEHIKSFMNFKVDERKEFLVKTPFRDRSKVGESPKEIEIIQPTFAFIDSMSNFGGVKSLDKMLDDNKLGESGANTLYMKLNAVRSRVINELPLLCSKSSTYFTITAHIGEKIVMDPYAPQFKMLHGLKSNLKFRGIPPNFYYYTSSCWWITSSIPLLDREKLPEYPRDEEDNIRGDQDLNKTTLYQLRTKNNASDVIIEILFSKTEGVLPSLTEFHYLRSNNYFGLLGNKVNFKCALYPNLNLTRKTIRSKLKEDPTLERAIKICSDILQIKQVYRDQYKDLLCSPEELYDDLVKMGYSWDILLDTVDYWTIKGEEVKPFLSTLDLLRMRKGLYHPYWLALDKRTVLDPKDYPPYKESLD